MRPDDSRLRDYARANRMRFEWSVWREAAHWHAIVRLWQGEKSVAWNETSTLTGAQAALDQAITLSITPNRQPASGPINMTDARQQGKAR